MKCFHVTTEHGARYGVAAHGKREAKQMVQDRLAREDSEAREVGVEPEVDHPASAEYVTTWDAEYGTVLCYTGPREDDLGRRGVEPSLAGVVTCQAFGMR